MRSALYPIIGERIYGPMGHAVDIFAVVGTVFGVATSLGFGVLQVNAGLAHLFGFPVSPTMQVILIVVITGLATLSVVSGLDKGIRILSELNLSLAGLLLLLIGILGPTVLLLKSFVQNTGAYLSDIINKTFNLYAYEPQSSEWLGDGHYCIGDGGFHGPLLWACLLRGSLEAVLFVSLLQVFCLFLLGLHCFG